jgi:diguanylate cyclase (GGDEF)-like protein/PAS domain S-box-containing protein
VTNASSTLIQAIAPIAVCGFILCILEGVKHQLLPNIGTLTFHAAVTDFVIAVLAVIGALPIALSIAGKKNTDAVPRQSEEQYRLLFENNSVPMWVYDRKTLQYLAINEAAIKQYGYSKQEFLSMTLVDLRPAGDVPALLNEVAKYKPGIYNSGIWRHRRKNGTILYVEIISHDLIFNDADACLAAAHDVTERKRTEDVMRQAEEKYRGIFENSVVGIFQSAPDGRFISINPALANMHGYDTPAELLEAVSRAGQKLLVDPSGMTRLAKAAEECGAVHGAELEIICKDGSSKWVRVNLRVIRDLSGKVIHREGTVEDITEHKAAQERMKFLAYYDALTGLPHRSHLQDRLDVAIAGARRKGEKIALLFIDLDRFKNINDSFGHSFGDIVLKDVAKRLRGCLEESNLVARLGGDEFLIMLCNLRDPTDAASAANRVIDAMKTTFSIQGRSLNVGCSVGISIFPAHGEDGETLIRNADVAMYSARASGRGNVRFFTDEMNAKAIERMNMDNNLQLALDREEFFLVYQPQLDIQNGRISGVEALIRWKHPEFGLIPPDKFIPIAENNGLILPIGEWALRTACAQSRRWQDEGLRAVPIAVNVSAVQFRQDNFLTLIGRTLRETGLAPEYLELEITESLLLSNEELTLSVLHELKEMGVRLSIDDFGTGYSCLSYLKQYPIDKLKIDKSFIRDCAVDCDGAAIAASIITMAHSLRLKVIAEGVENEAQMSFLRHHRCGEIQGFYFSKPVSAGEAASILQCEDSIKAPGEAAAVGQSFWTSSEIFLSDPWNIEAKNIVSSTAGA